MSRSIVLSNGELCVALDSRGAVRDIYYPHVGLEDHVRGHYIHRVGVWVDGVMSWLSDDQEWRIVVSSEAESLASHIVAQHMGLQIELVFTDIVYNELPIFLRRVVVKNKSDRERDIKLYMSQQFEIYKSHGGDTAYYDPSTHSVIHYKGRRAFLMGGTIDGKPFQDYATGLANFAGHEGSHRDADDGMLSKNPIEHGPADSIIGFYGSYSPGLVRTVEYWITAGHTIAEAQDLSTYVVEHKPAHLIRTATDFWTAWVNAYNWNFYGLNSAHIALFKKSLLQLRAHVDIGGGIIASLDSDMLQYGLDTYSYVWPRDSAFSALALVSAGDSNASRRFFEFCNDVLTQDGYLMHKYLPDRSLGSSWHPWVRNGRSELPIQEDETAIVLYSLGEHFKHTHDVEFIEKMYNTFIKKTADFMVEFRDPQTQLPMASYDLWEEKRGTSTYTCASVFGALSAAADLSKVLGKHDYEKKYRDAAEEIRRGIVTHLWNDVEGMFVKHISREGEKVEIDSTLDSSSAYGVFYFGVMQPSDLRLVRAYAVTARKLSQGIPCGGIARYQGDSYYRAEPDSAGNPWLVTTLWYAEYLIATAKKESDLDRVRDIFTWIVKYQQPSGVLSEQLDPKTGAQVSATPLAWSHAGYVTAVIKYLNKLQELGVCDACNPAP
jgi:glucoamylase